MTVVLTLSSNEEWDALVERSMISSVDNINELENVDNSVLVKSSVSLEELREALSLYDSVTLVYPAIQTVVSEELRAGVNSESAASSAAKLVDELLAIQRTARKKLKMLNMRSLKCATDEELTLLAENGWSLDSHSMKQADDVFILAAYQVVHQNKKIKRLADLLAASSIPLGGVSKEVKVDTVLDNYGSKLHESKTHSETASRYKNELLETQQKLSFVEAKLSSVDTEGELLRLQATQLQEELEKYFNLANKLETEESVAAERERELREAEKYLKELNGLQVEKISELELSLNDKNRALLELESQLNDELIKLERTNNELSNTQKLSVDTENLLTAANSRIGELNSEIELLKAHLSVVQSELETYFIKCTNAEEQKAEAQKEINRLQTKNDSAMRELATVERKLIETEEENRQQHSAHIRETTQFQREYSKLELKFNKVEEAKRSQHSAHIRETKQLRREYSKLELKFKQQRGELATQIHHVERLKTEIENIKASGSWKIGAPARAVGKVIGKVDRNKLKIRQDKGLIYTSELFDADWYLSTYPDVKVANIDPAEHYLEYGAKEGRLPSASFDGNWYLKRYPDVADSDVNPLVHYLKFGQNEGRSASPALLENFKD